MLKLTSELRRNFFQVETVTARELREPANHQRGLTDNARAMSVRLVRLARYNVKLVTVNCQLTVSLTRKWDSCCDAIPPSRWKFLLMAVFVLTPSSFSATKVAPGSGLGGPLFVRGTGGRTGRKKSCFLLFGERERAREGESERESAVVFSALGPSRRHTPDPCASNVNNPAFPEREGRGSRHSCQIPRDPTEKLKLFFFSLNARGKFPWYLLKDGTC